MFSKQASRRSPTLCSDTAAVMPSATFCLEMLHYSFVLPVRLGKHRVLCSVVFIIAPSRQGGAQCHSRSWHSSGQHLSTHVRKASEGLEQLQHCVKLVFGGCRFYLASDWTAKKLEVLVDVPEELNLSDLRGVGLQPGEEAQPEVPSEAAAPAQPAAVQPDPQIVEALMGMGFSENGSKRAAVATQVLPSTLDARWQCHTCGMSWCMTET